MVRCDNLFFFSSFFQFNRLLPKTLGVGSAGVDVPLTDPFHEGVTSMWF